jgi:hypothetical protein
MNTLITRTWRIAAITAAVAALTLTPARSSFASCADDDPDGSLVAAARATAEANCAAQDRGCTTATSHGAYVSCIAHEAKALSSGETPTLPPSCKGAVKRCAARSACGKQSRGFVTCCITNTDTGETKCKTKKGSDRCTAAGGVVGACASCCDACGGTGGPTCPAG